MSRRKGRRGAAQPAKDAPPRDPTIGRGKRPAKEAYHFEDEYDKGWIDPRLSEKPDADHQIQAICFAFEHMEESYRDKVVTGDLDPANAEFRLRGMLDTIRTLKWFKENKEFILKATRNGKNNEMA